MRAYFTQFGPILNLRLSRNKKTGASKHYAFIQFSSAEVADIVARTMNNYLMFGHILKVRMIPDEQIHPELWKGANKRFKVVPRAMLERKEMERAKGREYWKGKVEKESSKREAKRKAMEELGYEYQAPELKTVDDVPMKEVAESGAEVEKVVDEKVEEPKAIAEARADVDEVQIEVEKVIKKSKEEKKEKIKVKASKKAKA
jgi:nucleolar protein 15